MRTAIVIPSLGAPHLRQCLRGVAVLDPAPEMTVLVLSGDGAQLEEAEGFEIIRSRRRLGFAAAVNTGLCDLYPLWAGLVCLFNL